jgi:hypothetical protein
MAGPPSTRQLLALQHNCARGGQVLEAALDTAVRRGADLVLIQEPRGEKEKDGTRLSRSCLNYSVLLDR